VASDEEDAREGAYRLLLVCTSPASEPVRLELPPPTLERLTTRVSALGGEERTVASLSVDELPGSTVPAGGEAALDLGVHAPELGPFLAQRDRWRLEVRSGSAEVGGRTLPLRAPEMQSLELVHLAPFLPPEPVEPDELLRYVQQRRVALPPLMERAVRIPPERWNETLARFSPVADRLSDKRLTFVAPALRWLSRSALLGADPRGWRVALASVELPGETQRDGLDLPSADR
jgi:hypothetical protein